MTAETPTYFDFSAAYTQYLLEKGDGEGRANLVAIFARSAEAGNRDAYGALAGAYMDGDGVPQDRARAVELYKVAAERGNIASRYFLGVAYWEGRGVTEDRAEATRQWRLGADAGEDGCQRMLRDIWKPLSTDERYERGAACWAGDGVPRDRIEAMRHFEIAADGGYSWAYFRMAEELWEGDGIPQDRATAFQMYQRAEKHGVDLAMHRLGNALWHGDGVPQDRARALAYWQKGAQSEVPTVSSLCKITLENYVPNSN